MKEITGVTHRQGRDNEEFLHMFSDAESCLKRRIGRASTDILTESGRKACPLEGIVTQWDAARYPH